MQHICIAIKCHLMKSIIMVQVKVMPKKLKLIPIHWSFWLPLMHKKIAFNEIGFSDSPSTAHEREETHFPD